MDELRLLLKCCEITALTLDESHGIVTGCVTVTAQCQPLSVLVDKCDNHQADIVITYYYSYCHICFVLFYFLPTTRLSIALFIYLFTDVWSG